MFSEENVKKNFFRIFVKTAPNKRLHPTPLNMIQNGMAAGKDSITAIGGDGYIGDVGDEATGLFETLYSNYFEQVGSCNSEPKISSSDVEGITNNIGTKLGQSKNVVVDFILNDLDGGKAVPYINGGDNYNSLMSLDGTTIDIVYFDSKTGTCSMVEGVNASVNLDSTGNSFENVPFTAEKEANSITEVVTRYKLMPGELPYTPIGEVKKVSITTAGDTYSVGDIITQVSTTGVGVGFTGTVVALAGVGGDEIYAIEITAGGTGHAIGDVITVDNLSGTAATFTVTAIN